VKKTVLYFLAAFLLVSYTVSCGGRDDRDEIRANNGDPDEITTLGRDQFWRETWFYFGAINDSVGVAYEFRRSSGCGVVEDVYLFNRYFVQSTPSDSTSAKIILPATKRRNPLSPFD
jgi:hypothetical protein